MFPLSHIYVSTQVTGRKDPLLILGSVLPDIAWTSKSSIGREKIHNSPQQVKDYFALKNPELSDLTLGFNLHSGVNQGADYFSDDHEIGFAITEGRKIRSDVLALGEGFTDRTSLVIAHNFIEAGIDLNLLSSHSEILELYKTIDSDLIGKIIKPLSEYLGIDQGIIHSEITNFFQFVGPSMYDDERVVADRISRLISERLAITTTETGVLDLLRHAREMEKTNYLGFLDNAVTHMKKRFQS